MSKPNPPRPAPPATPTEPLPAAEPHAATFPVVGIGASAGGLEAFGQLLASLPSDTGMAFVLVQHLDPTHESELAPLLAKFTRMPVREAKQGQVIHPDCIYVIPPNTALTLSGDGLQLEPRDGHGPHLIDHFLRSLAEDRQAGAIGVVLSGAGTDGTLGLEDIKASGGITFAQDARSAKYPSMPLSAARAGCVDRILPPEQIAGELVRLAKYPHVAFVSADAPFTGEDEGNAYRTILTLLHSTFGVDFSAYRDSTIHRRIMRRMVLHSNRDLSAYAEHLVQDHAELEALYQDILINVTRFFRDPEVFEALKSQVWPLLLNDNPGDRPIRIWVPGCSTGQEAYSLAMTLVEFLEGQSVQPPIQIFATDLSDTRSLVKAREGFYPESIQTEVSAARRKRFFTEEEFGYRINNELREMVIFAKQNVARDPPFSHLDMISCRNLLIYLSPQLQKRVIPTFHYALNPTGFLLLGASETIGSHTDLFGALDPAHRIYSKKLAAARQYPHFRSGELLAPATGLRAIARDVPSSTDWQRAADRIAFGQYVPPGVLVNENLDILQFRGDTGPYLAPAPGEPSRNLFKMAREGLFLDMRSAVTECQQKAIAVRRHGVRARSEGTDHLIDLHVWPVHLPQSDEQCYLIQFAEQSTSPGPAPTSDHEPASTDESHLLRQELASTREYLQSIIAQQDAGNEDLRSANEEILSSNEELQSTNEELETAKEELQSVNEELTTVNEQLQNRNVEMSRLNDDLNNLITSARVATVVVDKKLRIRRFTPSAGELLELHPSDVGRSVNALESNVASDEIGALAARAIATMQVEQQEVRNRTGRWYSLRVHPYRTADNRIDGAVAVFMDVDEAKRAQMAVREALEYSQAIIETVREPLVILDSDLRVRSANPAFYRTFKIAKDDTEGRLLYDLGDRQWDLPELRRLLEVMLPQNTTLDGFEVRHDFPGIGPKVMTLNARRILRGDRQTDLILLAIEDHTVSAGLENDLRQHVLHLSDTDRERTVFLALLAHELRNPLAPIRNALHIIQHTLDAPPVVRNASEMMERQIEQMVRLVDDLIDVSRISRGMIQLHQQRVELASAVNLAVDSVRALAEASNLAVTISLPARPVYVDADPTRLAQCVGNLLHNACKFTNKGGRIMLAVELAGEHARIRVTDTGIGIAATHLPHVFEMFMQVDTSLERSTGGLGIGLALVKHLAELHGGTLTVASEGLGKGAEFTILLPLAVDQSVPAPGPTQKRATSPGAPTKRILVVDDNQDAADSLAMLLQIRGHAVITACDGLKALELAESSNPDIVLLDIGLPGLSGYEVAKRIRATAWGGRLTLIALTGWGKAEDREHSRRAGFNAHLVKPVNIDDLMAALADNTVGGVNA